MLPTARFCCWLAVGRLVACLVGLWTAVLGSQIGPESSDGGPLIIDSHYGKQTPPGNNDRRFFFFTLHVLPAKESVVIVGAVNVNGGGCSGFDGWDYIIGHW